jgi:transcriptional regulator NrdR family protein
MSRTHDVTISAFDLDRLERELAAVTEQRDRLAEELKEAQNAIEMMLRDSSCRRIPAYTEEQLAAVEGGSDE